MRFTVYAFLPIIIGTFLYVVLNMMKTESDKFIDGMMLILPFAFVFMIIPSIAYASVMTVYCETTGFIKRLIVGALMGIVASLVFPIFNITLLFEIVLIGMVTGSFTVIAMAPFHNCKRPTR